MKHSITTLLTLFALVFAFVPAAHADTSSEIKSRMAKRLGQIVALKKSGSVGENNQGYLTVRGNLSAKDSTMVKAENADRKAVYQIIATKAKTSAASVGKTRAASIRKSAAKGTWVQLPSGAWKQV